MTRPLFRQWEAVTFQADGEAQRQTVALFRSRFSGEEWAHVNGRTVTPEEAREVLEAAHSVTKVFEKLAPEEAAD